MITGLPTSGSTPSLVLNGDHINPFERGAQLGELGFTTHVCGQESLCTDSVKPLCGLGSS